MQQIATSASAESDKKRGAIKLLVLSIIWLRNFMPNAGTTGTKHDDHDVQCLTGGNEIVSFPWTFYIYQIKLKFNQIDQNSHAQQTRKSESIQLSEL
jgi:hypothetical protein